MSGTRSPFGRADREAMTSQLWRLLRRTLTKTYQIMSYRAVHRSRSDTGIAGTAFIVSDPAKSRCDFIDAAGPERPRLFERHGAGVDRDGKQAAKAEQRLGRQLAAQDNEVCAPIKGHGPVLGARAATPEKPSLG